MHAPERLTCKHNESVEFGDKLAPLCFKMCGMVYKCHKINRVGLYDRETVRHIYFGFCSRECKHPVINFQGVQTQTKIQEMLAICAKVPIGPVKYDCNESFITIWDLPGLAVNFSMKLS